VLWPRHFKRNKENQMICGHCGIAFHHNIELSEMAQDDHYVWSYDFETCPQCGNANISFYTRKKVIVHNPAGGTMPGLSDLALEFIYPFHNARPPCPPEVPATLAKDYTQACNVLPISPEASAALSRRCFQGVFREKGYQQRDLATQIQAVLDSNILPSQISSALHAARNIGNFAAHPMKSQHSGEILEVEPEEAQWNLEVLEALFDFYFVQPVVNQKRIDALNVKLVEAGKPPITTP